MQTKSNGLRHADDPEGHREEIELVHDRLPSSYRPEHHLRHAQMREARAWYAIEAAISEWADEAAHVGEVLKNIIAKKFPEPEVPMHQKALIKFVNKHWGGGGQLLRLMSSDNIGEALNALRAMDRTLKSAGADWHELADIVSGAPVQVHVTPEQLKEDRERSKWEDPHCPINRDLADHIPQHHKHRLSAWELQFVISLCEWRGRLTDKQYIRLEELWAKIQRGARKS